MRRCCKLYSTQLNLKYPLSNGSDADYEASGRLLAIKAKALDEQAAADEEEGQEGEEEGDRK